jgi:tetratricopeptide (TPR) repeat protein
VRLQHRAYVVTAVGDYTAADSMFRQVRRQSVNSLEWQGRTAGILSSLAEIRGRVREALQLQRERMAAAEARGLPEDYVEGAARMAVTALRYGDQSAVALAGLEAALARHPLDSMPPANRPYLGLARAYAAAGKVDQARRLLREYEARVPPGARRVDRERAGAYGAVLEAEGRLADAAAAYREWEHLSGECIVCGIPELAQVYDRMGQPDSARVLYERFLTTPSMGGFALQHSTSLAASYKRVGELYEASGNRQRAAEYYGKFVDLWKDADPELQPAVAEVRRRLGKLAQEPGA